MDVSTEIREDRRGLVFFPLQGRTCNIEECCRTFHLVTINPGEVRGNHHHPAHVEWLYLFPGEGVVLWREEGGGCQEQRVSGHKTLIYIPPGVPHAVRNSGPRVLYLLAWREAAGQPAEAETVPDEIG